MATDVLRPLLQDVVSKLPQDEAKTACGNICSTFGQKYSMHQNLLSLLEALTTDNRISPSNTFLLEECVPHSKTSKGRIQKSINEFQRKNKQLLTPTAPNRSFVGREERAVELSKLMQDDERHGVLLWGHSGVGKTTLAKEFLKTWEGSRRIVDLREVTDIRVVISEVLRSFGRPISIKDASMDSLISTLKSCKSTLKGKSVLLFDNADYFISNKEDEFADVTRNVVSSLEGQAKLLITSRNMCSLPEASVFLHQQQLQSLEVEPSKSILKNNMIHQGENEENINRTVGLCKSLPLNLNILGALLQDHDISLENILPEIEQLVQNLQKQELQKEVLVQDKTEQFTDVIVQNSFDRLSDTLQRGAVGLSLFARSFSFQSVKEVLKNYTDQQINLILESLRHVNLISMSFEEKTQRVYDIHPKVKQFLKEKASDEQFISFYQTSKSNFTSFFKSRLTNLSHLMEQDYLKAFELFHDDYANFEFLLDISQEGGAPVLLDDHYDLQIIGLLFESMFQNEKRLSLYQTWAAKAEREGLVFIS